MSSIQINYLQELDDMRNNATTPHILLRDLDFTDDDSYDQTDADWETKKSNWTTGDGWTPLSGQNDYNFDGDGHEIKNLLCNRSGTHFQGLFGDVGNVEIKNLGVVDASVTGNTYNGILVGLIRNANGTVENCWTSGTITGGANTGGAIGAHWGSLIEDSSSSATVNGAGGLIGGNQANVYNCHATGNVTSSGTTGGLIGSSSEGGIYRSYSTGNVDGGNYTGGLIGMKRTGVTVENCYSHSKTTGDSVVGGLIGDSGIYVDKCYSTGEVTATGNCGGLIGFLRAESINNSFWDTTTSGYNTSAGGTGKTTAEMKDIDTFTDTSTTGLTESWDMVLIGDHGTEVWLIDDGEDYPRLGWEKEDVGLPEGGSEAVVNIAGQGSGKKSTSGSSEATTGITAEATGVKQASGGSEAGINILTEAAGMKQAQGASEASVIVSSEGEGQKTLTEDGSETQVIVLAEAAGIKRARSPPAEAEVAAGAEGTGAKKTQGGSESGVNISAEGAGIPVKQGGAETGIIVSTEANGSKLAEGSGETAVTVSAEGTGAIVLKKSGGSEASVSVSTEGSGAKAVGDSSEATVSIGSEGQGQKHSAGGEEATVVVIPAGSGTKSSEGASEAKVVVETEAGGEAIIPYVQLTVTLEVLERETTLELLERETSLSILERETLLQVLERSTELTVFERSVSLEVEGLPKIGTTVRLKGTFKDLDNALIDLDNNEVKLKVYDGSRTIIESADCNRASEGVYYYDLVVPEGAGPVYWEMSGEMGGLTIVDRDKLEREW